MEVADCGRGRLFPRFRLSSRSSASEDANRGGSAFGRLRFALHYRCISASRLQLCLADGKSLLGINSVRSARQSTRRFIPFNGSLCRETMGNLAGHQNTCERDTSRNRAHTAVRGRFCNLPGAQVGLGRATCTRHKSLNALIVNYLNISSAHMFLRRT